MKNIKKLIYSFTFLGIIGLQLIGHADDLTQTTPSSSTIQSSQTASSTGTETSSTAPSSSSVTTNSVTQNTPASSQTQTSTTTQPKMAQAQNNSNNGSLNQTPTHQQPTKGSTTIINETVNNSGKSTNLWTIVLTSLSAAVTIIGGITALFRHFHKKIQEKPNSRKQQSIKKTKASIMSEQKVPFSKVETELTNPSVLTETQKMNLKADDIIKNHHKKVEFRRRRR